MGVSCGVMRCSGLLAPETMGAPVSPESWARNMRKEDIGKCPSKDTAEGVLCLGGPGGVGEGASR